MTIASAAVNTGLLNEEDNAEMQALLSGLDDEIIDKDEEDEVSVDASSVSEFELEAAVAGAEKTEAVLEAYAEQDATIVASEMNLEIASAEPAKKKAERKARDPSDMTVTGKLMKKTGGDAGVFILEPAHAELEGADLEAHAKALIDGASALPVKAGNKMQLLFGYLKNGGKLNEYLLRAFEVLARDGEIKTGDEGNYIQAMTKPEGGRKAFGLGTARSQVSQLGALLPYLKVATKEPGRFVLNKDSVVFAAVKANLGL